MIPSFAAMQARLKMQHLRLLLAIAEHGSLRRAASDLALTQPAVTRSLKDMEDMLGVPLFDRQARGLRPTRFGVAATHYAKLVFSGMQGLRDELSALETGKIGKVRIGSVVAAVPALLADALRRVRRDHPMLDVVVQVDTSDILVPQLEHDQLDLVLGRIPQDQEASHLDFEWLEDEELHIVVCRAHPLARRRGIGLAQLAAYSWILQPRPSPLRLLMDRSFAEAGVAPPSTIETAAVLLTATLLPGSDLVAVLPKSVAAFYERQDILKVLAVRLPRQLGPYGIVTRRSRPVAASTALVIDALRAAAAQPCAKRNRGAGRR